MPNIGSTEIIILLLVLVLLFGATRLPKAAEGIGKSLKVFKREIRSDSDSDEDNAQSGHANSQQNSQAIGGQTTESTAPATSDGVPQTHEKK